VHLHVHATSSFLAGPNTCFPFKVTPRRNICTFSINILTVSSVNLRQLSWEVQWKRLQPTAGQLPLDEEGSHRVVGKKSTGRGPRSRKTHPKEHIKVQSKQSDPAVLLRM